jgi:hypothetical protein
MSDENRVVVTDFDMPFGKMVNFLCKFWFAWLLSTLLIGVAVGLPIILILGAIGAF